VSVCVFSAPPPPVAFHQILLAVRKTKAALPKAASTAPAPTFQFTDSVVGLFPETYYNNGAPVVTLQRKYVPLIPGEEVLEVRAARGPCGNR
jgi:hypothetical protein